jgi:hypothetical protein
VCTSIAKKTRLRGRVRGCTVCLAVLALGVTVPPSYAAVDSPVYRPPGTKDNSIPAERSLSYGQHTSPCLIYSFRVVPRQPILPPSLTKWGCMQSRLPGNFDVEQVKKAAILPFCFFSPQHLVKSYCSTVNISLTLTRGAFLDLHIIFQHTP